MNTTSYEEYIDNLVTESGINVGDKFYDDTAKRHCQVINVCERNYCVVRDIITNKEVMYDYKHVYRLIWVSMI